MGNSLIFGWIWRGEKNDDNFDCVRCKDFGRRGSSDREREYKVRNIIERGKFVLILDIVWEKKREGERERSKWDNSGFYF